MMKQVVTADVTCLSSLIEQPLEARAVDQHDNGPSYRRRGGRRGSSLRGSVWITYAVAAKFAENSLEWPKIIYPDARFRSYVG